MKNVCKSLFRNGIIACLVLVLGMTVCLGSNSEKRNFDATKSLSLFNTLFKELDMYYVDTLDTEEAVTSAINTMLSKLDPYTEYYPESKKNDFIAATSGEYGGIGSFIMERNGSVYISEPYEGMPAQLAGLKAGDKLIMIDQDSLKGLSSDKVSERLKGPASTRLKVVIERPGVKGPISFDLMRKKIQVNAVTYYDVIGDSIGYIYLNSFTEKSAAEIKDALSDLKKNHHIKSLILDLRGNGGGILESAIQIVNYFVPKGKEILSTRGKIKQWDKVYKTTQEPIDTEIPLVVMIDGGTASSSEIVAGALQDLDRAVILGERSYGKGLVQSSRNMPYNGLLKLTIAKYYIPSGRLIQAIDYSHRNPDGSAGRIPDSLTHEFKTEKGRIVRDGGGIKPDVEIDNERKNNISYYLLRDFLFFDYATQYVQDHDSIGPIKDFKLTDDDYNAFKEYVKSKNFKYDIQSERVLADLKELAKFEGYLDDSTKVQFNELETRLKHNLDKDLNTFRDEIEELLSIEIVKRYYFQKGEIIESLKRDKDLTEARALLNDPSRYYKILNVEKDNSTVRKQK